jgi:hypothetical protein
VIHNFPAGDRRGALPSGSLSPLLRRLADDKQVLAVDEPTSTRPGRPALYRIADSNLRLYLGILRSALEQTRRGRAEAAFRIVQRRWPTWRGRAVEPLIRASLELAAAAGELPWPDVEAVGGWWNRRFDPEVDLVGADRSPVARHVRFVGSVTWLNTPFDDHDLAELVRDGGLVPGFTPGATGIVVVSRSGAGPRLDRAEVDLVCGPDDVLAAWQPPPRVQAP